MKDHPTKLWSPGDAFAVTIPPSSPKCRTYGVTSRLFISKIDTVTRPRGLADVAFLPTSFGTTGALH